MQEIGLTQCFSRLQIYCFSLRGQGLKEMIDSEWLLSQV